MKAERGNRRPTRRELLLAALLAGGALAVPGGISWLTARRRSRRLQTVRDAVPKELVDAVHRLGEAYLATRSTANEALLWSQLSERLSPWPPDGPLDAGFADRLRAAVEGDFAREATVDVNGLVLARTTASLCALVALAGRADATGEEPEAV